jgi:putative ABC transport system permease protein
MLTLLRTLSLGYFSQHVVRSALVVLSIALGVATLVATQAISKGLGAGIQDGVNPLASVADLQIVNGQTGVPMGLADQLREAHLVGVQDAEPLVMWRLSVIDLNNRVAWLIGVDWKRHQGKKALAPPDENLLGVKVVDVWKPGPLDLIGLLSNQPALVSANLATALDEALPGKRVFRLRNAGERSVTRVGTIDFANSSLPLKESLVVLMDVRSAAALCFPEKPDHVHQIGVKLQKGADPTAVQQRIKGWLGDRAEVQSVDAGRQMVSDVTAGLEIGLAIGGAGALVVGLFLVYNALSVSVAERRHDIGILRSVGATRRQIAGLFVSEATVMGLVGSLLGLPLGWLLAWLACKPLAGVVSELLVPIDSARIHLPPWLMLVAVVSGTLVAQLAALVPALQAASEEPADAVRRVPQRHPLLFAVLQVGGTILLLALGLLAARFRHQLPSRMGMFAGIVALLLGGLLLTPLLASLVGRLVQPLFRFFLGLEGRLAADNLVRTPGRTGLVIAALAASGGLLVQTAGFLKSSREAIHDWIDEKIAADLFVTSGSAVTSGGASSTMTQDMRKKVEAVEGIDAVLPVRFHRVDYASPLDGEKRMVFVIALDMKTFRQRKSDRPLARSFARFPRLGEPRTVVVSENFAALYKLAVGDRIRFPGGAGPVEATIVGTVTDYTWNRGTIIMDLSWFREEYRDQQVDVFDVFLKPGADPAAVRRELMHRYGEQEALFVLTRPDVNEDVRLAMNKIYGLAYAQQIVVGVVALLGVVSALIISVLQRRRELGLLRAVGATRAQILRSVLAEAVLMGVIGALVGFGIGLLLEWYVLDVMILDEAGFQFAMRIPWLEAGVVTVVSVLLATLAGLWPAYHATRLRIPEAIAYE